MTYSDECELGRQHAAKVIEDCRARDDMPALVRKIREMSAANKGNGVSIGFLYALAERATQGYQL